MSGVLRRYVPIVVWLPRYRKSFLPGDLIAGFTIWGLLIPEMIAYAGLAGLPPQAGLYTLLASLGLYAVFGTSRQLVVAGTSASAALVFSAVTAVGPHDTHHYAVVASGFIVITGIIFLVAWLLKLGFITSFLSRPVMEGFVFGLAIFVTVSQLPKLFGLEKGDGDTVRQLAHLVDNLGSTSVATLAVGAAALVGLFALERYLPRLPGGLVVLVAGIAISAALDLSSHGVATVDPAVQGAYMDLRRHPEARPVPGVLILGPDGPMFYANSRSIQDTVESLVASSPEPVRSLILDLDANDELDITSTEHLAKLVDHLHDQHIKVGFAHLHAPALEMARRTGILDRLGPIPSFETLDAATTWARSPDPEASVGPADAEDRRNDGDDKPGA